VVGRGHVLAVRAHRGGGVGGGDGFVVIGAAHDGDQGDNGETGEDDVFHRVPTV
jgi:hypothetical protein